MTLKVKRWFSLKHYTFEGKKKKEKWALHFATALKMPGTSGLSCGSKFSIRKYLAQIT